MDVEGEGEIEVEVDETDSEEEIEEIAEEYTFQENYHCIAQGHYDLLKCIDYNAINDTVSIVLHSVLDLEEDPDQEPVELVMNIQTLISILNSKEFPLTNAAFITIETIFNIPPSWLEQDLKYGLKLEEKANTTEEYFEVAIYSVVNFDMEKTLQILITILSKNPNHYYCFLLKTYIEYKNGAEDIYLDAIAELTKKFPNAIEPWVLLYCFYTEHNYRAGYQYAKMKIDQIFEVPEKLPSFIMTKDVYLDTIDYKDSPFCYTLLILLKMGLFDFCEIVFNYCKNDLSYEEQQTIFWPLLLYQGKINKLEQVLNSTPVDPRSDLYVTMASTEF